MVQRGHEIELSNIWLNKASNLVSNKNNQKINKNRFMVRINMSER